MARTPSPDRRRQIGDAALRAFSDSGFRLTQVADIARLAGTSPGTLYLYAPSKEALFVMALERSLGEEPQEVQLNATELLDAIGKKVVGASTFPALLSAANCPDESLPNLQSILAEVWDSIEKLAPTIRLIERCAQDWPDLARMFYDSLRPNLLQSLADYLERGSGLGLVRRPPNCQLAARLIVETTAWFTMHRHGDADGRYYDALDARQATLDALVHAYSIHPSGGVHR